LGWLFGCYLVIAGLERLLIEFLRAKDDRVLGPFTIAQAASVGLVLVGIYVLRRLQAPTGTPAPPATLVKPATAAR
jgi:prolipoprotein diacylglyceryltransferase